MQGRRIGAPAIVYILKQPVVLMALGAERPLAYAAHPRGGPFRPQFQFVPVTVL